MEKMKKQWRKKTVGHCQSLQLVLLAKDEEKNATLSFTALQSQVT